MPSLVSAPPPGHRLRLSLSPPPAFVPAAGEAKAGGSLYGLSAFNDLIRGTLLYITSCPAAPFSSLSLVFF